MSCCVPCRTETVYENRKAATQAAQKEADCQKQLEAALKKVAELEAQIAEAHKNPCCPAFKIESVTTVGKEVIVTFDNCTYLKAPMDIVDESLGKAKTDADTVKIEELSKALEALKAKVEEVTAKEDKDTVFDPSALEARIKALEDAPAGEKVDTTKFVRKDELVDVQNWAGTTRFKAYPADVATVWETPETANPGDKL